MKKIVLIICFLFVGLIPVVAQESPLVPDTEQKSEIPYKEPVDRKALMFKFLYAMGGVVASSLILYIGLSLYNKLREKTIKTPTSDYVNTLNTPNNLKDAVNIYLEKTKD